MQYIGFPRVFSAILLDCDGVLVDSGAAADEALYRWALRADLQPTYFAQLARGRRMSEVISSFVHADQVQEELAYFTDLEISLASRVKPCAGAPEFLSVLHRTPMWAVVTSADEAVAKARLVAAGLPLPPVLVAADDVRSGKPAPDAYAVAAARLGVRPERCLALDDMPIGIEAASRAGAFAILVGNSDVTVFTSRTDASRAIAVQSISQVCISFCRDEVSVQLRDLEEVIGPR